MLPTCHSRSRCPLRLSCSAVCALAQRVPSHHHKKHAGWHSSDRQHQHRRQLGPQHAKRDVAVCYPVCNSSGLHERHSLALGPCARAQPAHRTDSHSWGHCVAVFRPDVPPLVCGRVCVGGARAGVGLRASWRDVRPRLRYVCWSVSEDYVGRSLLSSCVGQGLVLPSLSCGAAVRVDIVAARKP
jgi:hypothetical protein